MSLRKIIKIFLALTLVSALAFVGLVIGTAYSYRPTVADNIINSVVIVENSSGIVIYQDAEYAIVLTAAHVIHSPNASEPFEVKLLTINDQGKLDLVPFEVEDYAVDDQLDLALLKVPYLDDTIVPAPIANFREDPKVGDDIYVAANPHYHYRSLKKGILSSKYRLSKSLVNTWEVDAMIIFGSSGGGAFTKDGKLFGVVSGIDALKTDHCWGIIDLEEGSKAECLSLPMTEIGYVVSPRNIRKFISSSKFAEYFDL